MQVHHSRRIVLVVAIALLSVACSPAPFPKELFTVHGAAADFPMMVSRTPRDEQGRTIHAESGTHFSQTSRSYSTANATVTVTTTETANSEMPASDKLLVQVRRNDEAIFIEHIEFYADDFAGYGFSSADRKLSIEAKVSK